MARGLPPRALMTPFQANNIGRAITGRSGIIPYQHKPIEQTLVPFIQVNKP